MVGEIISKYLYLEEYYPIMSGNEVKLAQGKQKEINDEMLKKMLMGIFKIFKRKLLPWHP